MFHLLPLLLLAGIFEFPKGANGLSLSYRWKMSEVRPCFYARVNDVDSTLQLYYSVSDVKGEGGNSLVDVTVLGPRNQILHTVQRQSHSETTIRIPEVGEYAACFTAVGGPAERTIDIDFAQLKLDGSPYTPKIAKAEVAAAAATTAGTDAAVPAAAGAGSGAGGGTEKLESIVGKLHKDLSDLVHNLRYIRNREKRNIETVETVEDRIFYFSLFETVLIVGMSILQVTILRTFFSSNRKTRV